MLTPAADPRRSIVCHTDISPASNETLRRKVFGTGPPGQDSQTFCLASAGPSPRHSPGLSYPPSRSSLVFSFPSLPITCPSLGPMLQSTGPAGLPADLLYPTSSSLPKVPPFKSATWTCTQTTCPDEATPASFNKFSLLSYFPVAWQVWLESIPWPALYSSVSVSVPSPPLACEPWESCLSDSHISAQHRRGDVSGEFSQVDREYQGSKRPRRVSKVKRHMWQTGGKYLPLYHSHKLAIFNIYEQDLNIEERTL